VAGATVALGLLGALSIGIFLLPVAALLVVLLATRGSVADGLVGAVSGLGLPLLLVAYLNRDGPGTVCTTTASSSSCTDEWAPLPWVVAGVALIVIGVAVTVALGRARARRPVRE